jgi:HEAT repeat protein
MATLEALLKSPDQSVRLKAALATGTYPNLDHIEVLIRQCASESDFFVRDTLSWALMRQDRPTVVQRLIPELKSTNPQSRSQALHTLSKIGDQNNYALITRDLLLDSDDFVASTAWRSASVLVPDADKPALVEILISQLGRGDSDTQFGLTRFLCAIGQPIVAALTLAAQSQDEVVRTHAEFTLIRFQEMELEKEAKPGR